MKDPRLAKYSAALSLAEVGLGSILHGFHIPFAGHFLAANQSLLLTLAIKNTKTRREAISLASGISTIAALAKALAPAGKRLTPMLALTVQGSLYSVGIALFGLNSFGVSLGALLLSLWSFAQPLFLSYAFFGQDFFHGLVKLWSELASFLHLPIEFGLWVIALAIALKALVTVIASRIAWTAPLNFEVRYFETTKRWGISTKKLPAPANEQLSPLRGAIKDLSHPWFALSFVLSVGFFAFSRNEANVIVALYALRSLTAGFLVFWIARTILKIYLQRSPKAIDL